MPNSTKRQRISRSRKVLTIILLPQIIFLWTTSWILTRTGSQKKSQIIRSEKTQIIKETKCNSKANIETRVIVKAKP